MDGKGGERKAVLRGHSWPSQPALEHPGGSKSGAFVVAPGGDAHRHGPPRCLLPLRRCYFWLSISAALQRVIFLPRSQDPARQRLSRWVVGRTPPACSAPRQPGDSPAPALLLPAQGGSWWPPSAKVRLDHPSLLVSWVWACMGNEWRPDATSRLFFSFSLRFKGKKPSLETRRQIITIKLICKLSWIFVLYPGKSCLKSVYLVFFLTSQHVFIVQNANLTLTSKFG